MVRNIIMYNWNFPNQWLLKLQLNKKNSKKIWTILWNLPIFQYNPIFNIFDIILKKVVHCDMKREWFKWCSCGWSSLMWVDDWNAN